jgi:hypothetical protein
MGEAIFRAAGDGVFAPTEQARGPWDPQALHGGAPAALIAGALEQLEPAPGLQIARLDFEFLRPVPLAPVRLRTHMAQAGRRVQRLEAELSEAVPDGRVVCRATALRVTAVPPAVPDRRDSAPLPNPEHSTPAVFSLDGSDQASFAATAMEMRWAHGTVGGSGPAAVWFRLRHPLVEGEALTPLMRVAAAADFGNGISAELPWAQWLFINADLTIRLTRPPRGEWIGLDARTEIVAGGTGVAVSRLHDEMGPVGLAQQTLVVQGR